MKTHYLNTYSIDVREGVMSILNTLQMLEGTCDLNTLCHILKGDLSVAISFSAMAYFGRLAHYHQERIIHLTNYLLNHGYIMASEKDATLTVTDKGLTYLENPSNLMIRTHELKMSAFDFNLQTQLCALRQELSETENLPTFRIFTDYVIQRVVQDRPKTIAQLEKIPGIGSFKAQKYGNQILALKRVITKIGNAIFLTNTTTSLGFGTFVFTDSKILVEFGVVAVCGIASVFLISITLLPIIQSFLAPPKERHTKHLERQWVQVVVEQLVEIVTRYRKAVYISTILITILATYGVTLMKTTGNIADDLPKDGSVYLDLLFFEENFKGVLPLEVTIDAMKKGGATKLSTLKRIDKLQDMIMEYPEFSKPLSIVEGLKFKGRMHFLLGQDRPKGNKG